MSIDRLAMHARHLPQRPKGRSHLEAQLALAELLLASDDVQACAQQALRWLGERASITQALCVLVTPSGRGLRGLASVGFARHEVEELHLDLELAPRLREVLLGREPRSLPRGARSGLPGFRAGTCIALPLAPGSQPQGLAVGLLVVEAVAAHNGTTNGAGAGRATEPTEAVRWVASVLGDKLRRLDGRPPLPRVGLARERSLLYRILDCVSDPILLTDGEGRLIIANARAEALFSASEDDSEGRRQAVTLNNLLFSSALCGRVVTSGETPGTMLDRQELALADPADGSDLLFEHLTSPIEDAQGGSLVVSVLRNITDLGRAAAEIRASELRLRSAQAEALAERHRLELIIDSVVDPIVVTDASGETVLMNDPAERFFTHGASADEQGGGSPRLRREEGGAACAPPLMDAVRAVRANEAHFSSFVSNLPFMTGPGKRYRGDLHLVDTLTGKIVPVEAVAGEVLSSTGELTWVVTILHDRTEELEKAGLYEELKQASEQLEAKVQAATAELVEQNELLRRQAVELEQASSLKSKFLASISHELRTPLNAVLGYTSMLLQGMHGALNERQNKSLSRVDSNARHLLALINDILDIARMEAGSMPVNAESFGVPELIEEVCAELEPIIARSRLEVKRSYVQELPQVHSDRKKVKQIVLNLLSNALKFTHEGTVEVTARHDRGSDTLVIEVSDTGIGIAVEDQEKIFEDFRQLDSSPTRSYMGTGLGLAICRRLAQVLNGRISLVSEPGKGSTFRLHLPRRRRRR